MFLNLSLTFSFLYAATGGILFVYGLNSLILCILYWLHKTKIKALRRYPDPTDWPKVTVQLPVYNESTQVEALLRCVADLDYPRNRVQIQVLDDSTDSTSDLLLDLVRSYNERGFDITYSHRSSRDGYKAANLNSGLSTASGDFIVIFDADFRPVSQFLKTLVKEFDQPNIAFIQCRWMHSNLLKNLVTAMGGIYYEGHLVVEQNARSQSGLFVNFTGSGGIWRKSALQSIGGWQTDTVTEDMDASFRAQLAGWKGKYYPFVLGSCELPEKMDAYKLQQLRWARGGAQNFKKHLIPLLKNRLSPLKKIMVVLHLLSYVTMPFLPILLILVLPVLLFAQPFFYDLWWYALGGMGPFLTFGLAQIESGNEFKKRLPWIPFVAIAAVGVSVVAFWGSITGLFTKGGEFVRTQRVGEVEMSSIGDQKRNLLHTLALTEFILGVYLILSLYIIWQPAGKFLFWWLGSSAMGFWLLSFYSLFQSAWQKKH